MLRNKLIYTFIITLCIITVIFGKRSMEFTSAKTYARVEKNLDKAAEFGLIALEKEPDNAYIPYFLGREVFMQQKKRDEAGEMFIEALNRPDSKIQTPFRIGDRYIRNVHEAVSLFADDFFNYGVEEYNKQDIEKALEMFNVATTLDSMHIKSFLSISEIYYKDKNNIDKALQYIDTAIGMTNDEKVKIELLINKSRLLRKNNNFEAAKTLLIDIEDKLDLFGRRELFLIYIDLDEVDDAISIGTDLLYDMEEDLSLDQSAYISESAYNLAILYRIKGLEEYNSIINYFTDESIARTETDDANYLNICEDAIENFSAAKEYFEISYDYDDNASPMIKEYRKEMKKMIKRVEEDLVSALSKE